MTGVADTRGGLLLPGRGVDRGHKPHVDGPVSLESVGGFVPLQVAAAITAIHVLREFGDSSESLTSFGY